MAYWDTIGQGTGYPITGGPVSTSPQDRVRRFDEREVTPTGATPGVSNTGIPALPDYSQIQSIIQQINATNQQAQSSANAARIPNATALETQSSQNIAALLNPPSQYGELDVGAAARGVASGTVGSPFAGVTGLNLTRTQQNADRAAGQQQLNMAYARNPGAQIADPQQLLHLLQQQAYGAQQGQLSRDLQERIVNAQMANAALQNRLYGRFRDSGGSGGRYGPQLPTQYTRPGPAVAPTSQTNIPAMAAYGGGGLGTGYTSSPNIGALDNWAELTGGQQAQYNATLGQNQYFGLPDWQNPYSGDAPPPSYDPYADDYFNYFA